MLTTPSRPEENPNHRKKQSVDDKSISGAKIEKADNDGVSQRSTSRLRQPTPVSKSPALKATIEKIEKKQGLQHSRSKNALNARHHSARMS